MLSWALLNVLVGLSAPPATTAPLTRETKWLTDRTEPAVL